MGSGTDLTRKGVPTRGGVRGGDSVVAGATTQYTMTYATT